jgi:glycosyltransferase involved in cell wall biosynthesis
MSRKVSTTHQRVVHIITCLATDGAAILLYRLLAQIDREQFDPIVIVLDAEVELDEHWIALNIPVHYLNMKRSLGSSWHVLRLAQRLRQLKPDVIQGWMYHGNLAATLANRLLGDRYPLVWNIHQGVYDLQQESFTTRHIIQWCARLSKKPSYIIYNAYASARQHEAMGYMTARTNVIPNGFDTQLFCANAPSREGVRQELNIPPDAVVIGMVAHYHPSKNHELFLAAASFIHQHYPTVHFILAGRNITAKNLPLAEQCAKHGLHTNLHLLGERKDMPAILNAMDIFSLTSEREAFPHVVGEAMACGVPCITTDVGDIARIIGNTGRVMPEPSPSKLAFAWLEWMQAGEIWRKELGQRAAERIQQHYSIHRVTAQYQDIYKELVNVRTNGVLFPSESTNADQYVGQPAQDDQHPEPSGTE